jgi:hypothetical protein
MLGNKEAVRMHLEARQQMGDHWSGSKPRMHGFEGVWWSSCSRFKPCATVPIALAATWRDYDRPWSGDKACGCGGAGMPCPSCNVSNPDNLPRLPAGLQRDESLDDE